MASAEAEEPQRLPDNAAAFLFSVGFEGMRRHNLCYIADTVLLHSCGNTVHLWDIQKNSTTYLPCVEGCGIGAVTVHPSRQWFAVCEKGLNPSIYIYEYPMLTPSKILRDGTERLYTAAAFNHNGTQLATVGGFPDYWLTVWDWSNETIILRAKAFSQDVFTVSFSKFFSGQLLTSGVGHIRFWKMAYTFTGLKLEGFIGKFGQVTISDIAGYVELSNGKVISGTESGGIIVWEGELVKCQLKRQGSKPCHDGMIELVILDEEANQLITAGADGYIKFWSFGEWLDAADDGDEKLICEVDPLRELQVGSDCRIKGIIFEADHWIIQDEAGAIWRVNIPSFELEKLMEFHSGSIIAAASSPNNYYIASAGSDGTVRLYNFSQQSQVYMRQFSSGATALTWFQLAVDAQDGCNSTSSKPRWRDIGNCFKRCDCFLLSHC